MPVQSKLTKGTLSRIEGGAVTGTYEFLFNPSQVQFGLKASWDYLSAAGTELPVAAFGFTEGGNIRLELLVDRSEASRAIADEEGILPDLAFLQMMVRPELTSADLPSSLGQYDKPALYWLVMGPRAFKVVCDSYDATETRFSRDLVPLRATVRLELREVYDGAENGLERIADQTGRRRLVER